jgi:hypothetical protein
LVGSRLALQLAMINWRNVRSLGLLAVLRCDVVVDTHDVTSVKADGESVARWTGTVHADHLSTEPGDPGGYAGIKSVATDKEGNAWTTSSFSGANGTFFVDVTGEGRPNLDGRGASRLP